jgi:hypothetical protein
MRALKQSKIERLVVVMDERAGNGSGTNCFGAWALAFALGSGLWIGDAGAAGPWRADAHNIAGWNLMTPDERLEHQRRLRSTHTLRECRLYDADHRRHVEERARRRNAVVAPRSGSACDQLQAVGWFE